MNFTQQDDSKSSMRVSRFWLKVGRFAHKAGSEVLEKALILYYVSRSDQVPKRYKAMVLGALAYFISTIDAIPDLTPVIGFGDDLAVLAAAVAAIAHWVKPEIREKADNALARYFPAKEEAQQDNKRTHAK